MFSGPSGIGKTTLGRIFSRAVLCESIDPKNKPCLECVSCKEFSREQNYGFRELDAASFGGKETMVKLRDDAAFQSVSKKKIILLDESHDISEQGQDALLKQVEQCPEHLIYIFCTTEPNKMNPTLRKRCMEFHLSKISSDIISGLLESICKSENFNYDLEALKSIAVLSKGHVRDSLNILEETSYLGNISVQNLNKVSKNHDDDIFEILSNLGININICIDICKRISDNISSTELYDSIIEMLNDTAKVLYGYEDFLPHRKSLLYRLRDIHGFSILEFLDYLLKRDKYIDRIGLQSDIIILHYKFQAKNFAVKSQPPIHIQDLSIKNNTPQSQTVESGISNNKEEIPEKKENGIIPFSELSKMSVKEKSALLREKRKNQKVKIEEEKEIIHKEWPLPKEERLGDDSSDDEVLSPEEFSQNLVGGRNGRV